MIFLLDLNTLIALAHQEHPDHQRVALWYHSLVQSEKNYGLATCSITEIGFLRVSIQAGYQPSIQTAQKTLELLKSSLRLSLHFVSDSLDADQLPSYVSGVKQITDGHLYQLALTHSMELATLDRRIPNAYHIPHL